MKNLVIVLMTSLIIFSIGFFIIYNDISKTNSNYGEDKYFVKYNKINEFEANINLLGYNYKIDLEKLDYIIKNINRALDINSMYTPQTLLKYKEYIYGSYNESIIRTKYILKYFS